MEKNIVHLNQHWFNYHVYGAPSNEPPLVCLHGVTGNAWLWHEAALLLAHNRQVISLDFRGHGDSSWCAEHHYNTEHHVQDLLALVDHLGLDKFSMAGMSWGALVAIQAQRQLKGRLHKLVVLDVEASFEQAADAVAPRPQVFTSLAQVCEWEQNANRAAPAAAVNRFACYSVAQLGAESFARKHDPYFFSYWPFRNDNQWQALAEIDQATLFIHGERSFVRGAVMEEMRAATPGAVGLLHVADAGHIVAFEQPKVIAEAIGDFLIDN